MPEHWASGAICEDLPGYTIHSEPSMRQVGALGGDMRAQGRLVGAVVVGGAGDCPAAWPRDNAGLAPSRLPVPHAGVQHGAAPLHPHPAGPARQAGGQGRGRWRGHAEGQRSPAVHALHPAPAPGSLPGAMGLRPSTKPHCHCPPILLRLTLLAILLCVLNTPQVGAFAAFVVRIQEDHADVVKDSLALLLR